MTTLVISIILALAVGIPWAICIIKTDPDEWKEDMTNEN